MKCPNCNVNLVMAERTGIEIDYCPDCRGVWLDRGELDKIIERSATTLTNQGKKPENENYRDKKGYSQDEHYKHKHKKGFFGDLFDF